MCRVPDPEDAKYKDDEDAYEDDLKMLLSCWIMSCVEFQIRRMPSIKMKRKLMMRKYFPTTKVQFTGMTVAGTLSLIQINPRRTLSLRTCTSLSIPALNRSKYTQVARRH